MTTDSPQLSPADPRAHVPALARMFEALTQDELRSLMYLVHERAGLELPGTAASHAALALHAAEMVINHSALDAELLQALLELRPRRRPEIAGIAQAAGIALPAPVPAEPTPMRETAPAPGELAPTHTAAPSQNPPPPSPAAEPPRYGPAALIYAALSAVLFVVILVASPEQLPSYKLAMVAVSVALMAGFLSVFLTGHVLVRLSGRSLPWHPMVEASGGLAIVAFVLVWWPKAALEPPPLTPTSVAPQPEPEKSPDKPPSVSTETTEGEADPAGLTTASGVTTGRTRTTPSRPAPRPSRSKWTITHVADKTMTLKGPDLPPAGLLRLVTPVPGARIFVSTADCRIEVMPMTCMLVTKPGNPNLQVGDVLELQPPATP